MTKGQYRVGITFNPSGDPLVASIKNMAAELIDAIDEIPIMDGSSTMKEAEVRRLRALAQTHIEDAAMWAVKAATKGEPT